MPTGYAGLFQQVHINVKVDPYSSIVTAKLWKASSKNIIHLYTQTAQDDDAGGIKNNCATQRSQFGMSLEDLHRKTCLVQSHTRSDTARTGADYSHALAFDA
ncbi:hypothetical protein D3C73_1440340 [compost metagenome]